MAIVSHTEKTENAEKNVKYLKAKKAWGRGQTSGGRRQKAVGGEVKRDIFWDID